MANVKITGLTAAASLTADDLLAIVDDPSGTPETKRATLQQVLDLITAADVENTPSGNLSATDVQAALNELQTDVDTRATAANLTAHEGDFDADHGDDHDVRDHSTALGTASVGDLADVDTTTDAPAVGDAMVWDGSEWVPDSGAYVPPPGYAAGDYVQMPLGATTSRSLTDGRLFASLVYLPADIDQLAAKMATAGTGGTLRLGVYAHTSGRPGAVLVDAGTINLNSTTPQQVAASVTGKRWVWVASLVENLTGSPVAEGVSGISHTPLTGLSEAGAAVTGLFAGSVTAGALPDPFPSSGINGITSVPKISGRVA